MLVKLSKNEISILCDNLNKLSVIDKEFFHPHAFTIEYMSQMIDNDFDHYFIFKKNNEFVGYSMLRTFDKYDTPTFGGVIWGKHRGKGYGKELVIENLIKAKELGFKEVKLKVFKCNEVAVILYKSVGFEIIGEKSNIFWMRFVLNNMEGSL